MNWTFIDNLTLIETQTGYIIHLLSGSWTALEDIIPESPEDLPFLEQARLLREGLSYAELYCMHNQVLQCAA